MSLSFNKAPAPRRAEQAPSGKHKLSFSSSEDNDGWSRQASEKFHYVNFPKNMVKVRTAEHPQPQARHKQAPTTKITADLDALPPSGSSQTSVSTCSCRSGGIQSESLPCSTRSRSLVSRSCASG